MMAFSKEINQPGYAQRPSTAVVDKSAAMAVTAGGEMYKNVMGGYAEARLERETNEVVGEYSKAKAERNAALGQQSQAMLDLSKADESNEPEVQRLQGMIKSLDAKVKAGMSPQEAMLRIQVATKEAINRAPWLTDELKNAHKSSGLSGSGGVKAIQDELELEFEKEKTEALGRVRLKTERGININDPQGDVLLNIMLNQEREAKWISNQKDMDKYAANKLAHTVVHRLYNSVASEVRAATAQYKDISQMPAADKAAYLEKANMLKAQAKLLVNKAIVEAGLGGVDSEVINSAAQGLEQYADSLVNVLTGKDITATLDNELKREEDIAMLGFRTKHPDLFRIATLFKNAGAGLGSTLAGSTFANDLSTRMFNAFALHKALQNQGDAYDPNALGLGRIQEGNGGNSADARNQQQKLFNNIVTGTRQLIDAGKDATPAFDQMAFALEGMSTSPKQYTAGAYNELINFMAAPNFAQAFNTYENKDVFVKNAQGAFDSYLNEKFMPAIRTDLNEDIVFNSWMSAKVGDVIEATTTPNGGVLFTVKPDIATTLSKDKTHAVTPEMISSMTQRAQQKAQQMNSRYNKTSEMLTRAHNNLATATGTVVSPSDMGLAVYGPMFGIEDKSIRVPTSPSNPTGEQPKITREQAERIRNAATFEEKLMLFREFGLDEAGLSRVAKERAQNVKKVKRGEDGSLSMEE